MTRAVALACLCVLVPCRTGRADPPVPQPDDRPAVVVPFELLATGHMAVRVTVNGRGPFRFVFDTGAPGVMLSGTAARAGGLIPATAEPGFLGGYSETAKPATLRTGRFEAAGVVAGVQDHPTVRALASAVGPLDGLAGFDLFTPNKLTIDYRARTLTVQPARGAKPYDNQDADRQLLDQLLGSGKAEFAVPAAVWGLTVRKAEGDDDPGVDVAAVQPGSAADQAGLRPGDRLLVMSRRWTDSVEDAYRAASFVWAGKASTVTVRRGGKTVELVVKPRPGL